MRQKKIMETEVHRKNVAEDFWKGLLIYGTVITTVFIVPLYVLTIKAYISDRNGASLFAGGLFAAVSISIMTLCLVNYLHYHRVKLEDIQRVRLYRTKLLIADWQWRSRFAAFDVTVTVDGIEKEVTTGRYFSLIPYLGGVSLRKYECQFVEIGHDRKRDRWIVISK